MKKILLLLTTALLCVGNMWATVYTTDFNSKKEQAPTSFTNTDGVTFSLSTADLTQQGSAGGLWGVGASDGQLKLTKAKTTSLTWSNIPDGFSITITGFSVTAASGGNHTWFAYTNTLSKSDDYSKKGTSDQTVTLPDIAFSSSTTSIIIEASGSSELYIKGFSVTYDLVSAAAPNITIKGYANITNAWHSNLNFSDYINLENNPANVTVSASSDDEIATYDSNNEVFVIGHKTGTASFTISADDVEDKTFTITTNQYFYEYAKNVIVSAAACGYDNTNDLTDLDATTNIDGAKGVLTSMRTNLRNYISQNELKDKDITALMENNSFECGDHAYGWTINGYEAATGKSSYGNYAMYMEKGGVASIDAGSAIQTINDVPTGFYKVSCYSKIEYIDGAKLSVNGIECAINRGESNPSVAFYLNDATVVTISYSHPSNYDTYAKKVTVDNFSLTYVCDKATYDAYMEQYNRANDLKDNPKLLTDLNTALKEAQKDILTLAGANIAGQTVTLKNACDAAAAHINWVNENAVAVNETDKYLLLYSQADAPLSVLSRGADYDTRAIVTNSGLKLNVQTNNETLLSTVTFRDTNKKLFVTTDNAVYTDYNNSGEANFYFVNAEGGYKIVLASDHDKALYVTEDAGNKVVMLTTLDNADIWCFANEVSASVSISDAEWATYYNSQWAFIVPEGLTAVVAVEENSAFKLVKDVYTEGSIVPAGEAVLLNGEAGPYTLNFVFSSATPYVGNLLKGSDDALSAANMANANPGENYFYGLSLNADGDENSIGFYWMNDTGAAFDNAAHKAYLFLPKSSTPAPSRFVFGPHDVPTDLDSVSPSTNSEQTQCKKLLVNGVLYIIRDGKTYDSFGRMVK